MCDKVNKKYKDSVFVDLFYEDETAKVNELSLYNALFDTDYTLDDIEIEKIRVDNVVYMNLKNDVSFNVGPSAVTVKSLPVTFRTPFA